MLERFTLSLPGLVPQERTVTVCLPEGYADDPGSRYPAL